MRLALRALWLALLVWSLGTVPALLGYPLPALGVWIATGSIFALCLAYAWFSHPSLMQLAHGLDDRYQLGEQLATALEVTRRAEHNPVEERLVVETDALLGRIRRYIESQPVVAWRELETCVAVALLAIGIWFANGPLFPDAVAPVALPVLPTPVAPTETARQQPEPTEQPVREEQQSPQLSPEAQAAADAIADALRDNGATSSAADALDQGDTAGAARELRELADQADQLSDQGRQDLAKGLRDAAEQLRESQPDLADRLEQQADALERGGEETAKALEDLARTVEQLAQDGQQAAEAEQQDGQPGQQGQQGEAGQSGEQGQPGAPGGSGAGNQLGGEQRGAQPDDAAQAQGDALPLPESENTDGPTTEATGPKGPQVELGAGGVGETNAAGGNAGSGQIEADEDPLTIPPEYRDVVEDYFSPQP